MACGTGGNLAAYFAYPCGSLQIAKVDTSSNATSGELSLFCTKLFMIQPEIIDNHTTHENLLSSPQSNRI
jgi:hypothetical protein